MSDPDQDGDIETELGRVLACTTRQELQECSDEQILYGIKELEETVYVLECFGRRDLILLEWLNEEADRRGWKTESRAPHTWKIRRNHKSPRGRPQ